MAQEIFCPNCGGLIFSSDPDAMQMHPCTCAAEAAKPAATSTAARSAESTSETRSGSTATTATPTSTEPKICIKCGKDVNGHRRYKDENGAYWCLPCAKEDDRKKRAATQPARSKCALCSTEISVTNLIAVDGRFLCPKCVRETRELEKKTEARIGRINTAFKGQDWKRLTWMLAALGLCLLIILLRQFHLIGS
jgi:DNA-directed RNA polymerase subunit RPC12/RpoP